MGFAAIQNHADQGSPSALSALEHLQIKLITDERVVAAEIFAAVSEDIANARELNQTILMQVFATSKISLNSFDFQKLALLIRDAMILLPLTRAELFINYAQGAALCMKNIYVA